MTLGSRVYDSAAPGRIGVFNGFRQSFGRRMAMVKFPGEKPRQIPAERIERALKPGRKPAPKLRRPPRKPGRKPRKLLASEIELLANQFGISEEEFVRMSAAAGLTVRQMMKSFKA